MHFQTMFYLNRDYFEDLHQKKHKNTWEVALVITKFQVSDIW